MTGKLAQGCGSSTWSTSAVLTLPMAWEFTEWLNLVLRWTHIIAAISWIGSSFYFMWLDKSLESSDKKDENLAGSLWMVHSGGFYRVEKRYLAKGQVPQKLHWFKYEALFTWLTGFSLLILIYYAGGILLDSADSTLSNAQAITLGVSSLIISWVIYDALWLSPVGNNNLAAITLSYLLLVGLIYLLTQTLSARASYLHVGAVLGTLMVANVWMRILPAQRQMIAATQAGKERDMHLAKRAKQRSVHNNYMTFPVIFIMISHHFPSTFGSEWNWLILSGLVLVSTGIRHLMNLYE